MKRRVVIAFLLAASVAKAAEFNLIGTKKSVRFSLIPSDRDKYSEARKVKDYKNRWTINGYGSVDKKYLIDHLVSGHKGFDRVKLSLLTRHQLYYLHDQDHERTKKTENVNSPAINRRKSLLGIFKRPLFRR
tara:strand:+ start:1715 stop:2110 length:396 start_codon:yes stop_codon:yes gene_type:complete